eukprot:scaffold34032_cov22-Tisochrysis_lutea.AAC.1
MLILISVYLRVAVPSLTQLHRCTALCVSLCDCILVPTDCLWQSCCEIALGGAEGGPGAWHQGAHALLNLLSLRLNGQMNSWRHNLGTSTLSPSHRGARLFALGPKALQKAGSPRAKGSTTTMTQAATNMQPTLQRLWEIDQPGAVSRLRLNEKPLPALKPGQASACSHYLVMVFSTCL